MRMWALALGAVVSACALPRVPARPVPPPQEGLVPIEGPASHGMAWRLWMPDTPRPPRRFVVWLHPSRGSGEPLIEPLAPLFARHGYALLVPLKPEYAGWTSEDVRTLFGELMPVAAKTPGIDPREPVVIGWSAGGQMALHLWQTSAQALGGVVLVGTTPELLPGKMPPRDAVEGTAVLSIVGALERGAPDWKAAFEGWRAWGVPLTLKVVPDRAHEWLFSEKPEQNFLETWLDAISRP